MNNDTDWVADVKRWVMTGAVAGDSGHAGNDDSSEIGYEAAHPALEARHWPEAVTAAALLTTGR